MAAWEPPPSRGLAYVFVLTCADVEEEEGQDNEFTLSNILNFEDDREADAAHRARLEVEVDYPNEDDLILS